MKEIKYLGMNLPQKPETPPITLKGLMKINYNYHAFKQKQMNGIGKLK